MERLTQYFEVGAYTEKQNIIDISNNLPYFEKAVLMGKVIDKLADFEDFMENLGLEDLEELEHIIGYPRFIDGYNEQGKEINKIEFITYKESFDEVSNEKKKLKQENQALKDRWRKLKEFIKKQSKPKNNIILLDYDSNYIMNDILYIMQELEKEGN